MDAVTQFALGAGVGAAVLGRRLGPRKAALTGGVLGVMPDLDLFVPHDNPIEAFVQHRTWTHSLIVQALAAPLFAEGLMRLFNGLRDARLRTYLAVYLCFATHPLLDFFTVYGTQLFWPLWPEPLAVGSVFIIDPLYTLPLLVALIWALFSGAWTSRFRTALTASLALSSAYLGWGVIAQQVVEARAQTVLAEKGIVPERLLGIPTPFNTLFWRVIAVDGDRYFNLYGSVFGGREQMTAYAHPRGNGLEKCLNGNRSLETLAWFSRGFYRIDKRGGEILVSDLRMGLTPNYVFRYLVAEHDADGLRTMPPQRRGGTSEQDGDIDWLLAGLANEPAPRPAEAGAAVEVAALAPAPKADHDPEEC
jgi:inner membrane protein